MVMFASSVCASADDWSGWMGDRRDGVYRETGIIDEIPQEGLSIHWRTPIGPGYAGPAVADGRVFVFDYLRESGEAFNDPNRRATLKGRERLTALDAATGEVLWRHAYDCPYSISYPSGPRCTPTVAEDDVVILGAQGDLQCLSASSGEVRWRRSFEKEFGAEVPVWGYAGHPLIYGDLVLCMVGGPGQCVVAFDRATGATRWSALDASSGYAPPSIIQAGGMDQLIVFHPQAVVSLQPLTGKQNWSVPMNASYEMSIARPMVDGNLMYASSIHSEAVLLELAVDAPTAKERWRGERKTALYAANSTPLLADGVIYGTDCNQGSLIAVSCEDGSRLWETFQATRPDETRFVKHGTAFITRIGDTDRYFIMSETGDLLVARLKPDGYHEQGRFRLLEPTSEAYGRNVMWSHPAYANRTIYARNDTEVVAASLAK